MKPNRIEALKPLLVLLIVIVAGPEFFLSMELLTLLDILGVGLFLLVHAYAVRLALLQLLKWAYRWAVPIQLLARPTAMDIREEPGLLFTSVLAVPIFYFSWCAIGFLSFMIGTELLCISI